MRWDFPVFSHFQSATIPGVKGVVVPFLFLFLCVTVSDFIYREELYSLPRETSHKPSSMSLSLRIELPPHDEPRSEGYDEFLHPPLESKYECSICLLGLREPVQTSCGHRFCKGCILRSIIKGKIMWI